MKIGGPSFDATRKGQKSPWYLSLFVPQRDASGTLLLDEKGNPVVKRQRTYYGSKALATADTRFRLDPNGRAAVNTHIAEEAETKTWRIAQVLVDAEDTNDWELRFTLSLEQSRTEIRPVLVFDTVSLVGQ